MRMPASPRLRTAQGRHVARYQPIARPYNWPPPVGGWNTQDSLENMKATDAVNLSNWFPRQSDAVSRPGFTTFCDVGLNATIRTLVPFEYAGTTTLLACGGGQITEVSSGTAVALTHGQGFSGNDWIADQIGGTMVMVNGVDAAVNHTGFTSVNPNAFTGVSTADLNYAKVYKSRMYLIQNNSASFWYGGVNSIAGALTQFHLDRVASVKGSLMLLATITGDGGTGGVDDIFVAIFSGGTVIAYNGSDPGDATNWRLVGVYQIGRPLSRFGILQADGDIFVLTTRGYEQLGAMIKAGPLAKESRLVSSKIQLAVTKEISAIGATDGWRLFVYPHGQMMMVTVPRAGDARHMHVRNVNTGAWARFDGFRPACWALLGTQPYFGGDRGIVYKFDDGATSDDGDSIRCDAQPAWNFLGHPGSNKQVQLLRPFFRTEIYPSVAISTAAEFAEVPPGTFGAAGATAVDEWDTATWDTATWRPDNLSYRRWYHRPALGDAIGLRVMVDVSDAEVRWNMTRVLYTLGGLV